MRTLSQLLVATLVAAIVVLALLQFVRPSIPTAPATAEVQAPPQVLHILQQDCYSCHSGQRRLSWFDQIVPAYWLVRHDVLAARARLNFSTLGAQPAAAQRATLFEAVNMVQLGAMPLPRFVRLHPDSRVTPADLAALKAYLSPWATPPDPPTPPGSPVAAAPLPPSTVSLSTIQPEPNGLAFDPSFAAWQPISTTDRGDNNTLRLVLGNDVAVQAVLSGHTSPWPDGARLAKVAWRQQLGADGLIHPGQFVQVEFIVKNARQNKSTEGWAWGRWRGADLHPYGDSAGFVNECTGCHRPLRGNDYAYTLPISDAPGRDDLLNHAAAILPVNLPFQPLTWNAITLLVGRNRRTASILYGNEAAIRAIRAMPASPSSPDISSAAPAAYPPGAVLALVTWTQRDDPHWFGARIPGPPQSVEFVRIPPPGTGPPLYMRFFGPALAQQSSAGSSTRAPYLLALPPAWLP